MCFHNLYNVNYDFVKLLPNAKDNDFVSFLGN